MRWDHPISTDLGGGMTMHTPPPPASGVITGFIMKVLKRLNFNTLQMKPGKEIPIFWHRLAEAFKWAYGARTKLADPRDPDVRPVVEEVTNQ